MSDIAISVNSLTKVYKLYNKPIDRLKETLSISKKRLSRDHYALNDINFEIKKGETVGIIGTNGSGKSTILKIITGVLNPTYGSVDIDGRISALLELGAGFNPEYSGIENVYLNGMMIGFSREEIDEKLDDILAFADIGDFVYQPVKTYSSGMFVRLAFAVAINIDPEILIVDEALSVGDVFFQAKCYNKFEEFKKMGKTILIVSHDLGSITKYCDKVILLNNGVLLKEGEPKEIVDLYKKILVNGQDTNTDESTTAIEANKKVCDSINSYKNYMNVNDNIQDYGDGGAIIYDYGIIDNEGNITNTLVKGKKFKIVMKVRFNRKISNPIFAFTIKDIKGTDISGTNTMYEKVDTGIVTEGDMIEIHFSQNLMLQGGEYLLSLGCTGYEEGEFKVYNRLYDVFSLVVISEKNTGGFFDMDSQIDIIR